MVIDPAVLAGHWVHSHEEDSAPVLVYRPKSHALPPARGRKAMEIHASGEYIEHGFGPTDRRVQKPTGHWRLDGDELVLTDDKRSEHRLRVVELTPDRLRLEKR